MPRFSSFNCKAEQRFASDLLINGFFFFVILQMPIQVDPEWRLQLLPDA
jgi:hypothetical protein